MSTANDNEDQKTTRVALFCGMLIMLGIIASISKACESCDTTDRQKNVLSANPPPKPCQDEFLDFERVGNPTCTPGAVAEIVTSPRTGILCHCKSKDGSAILNDAGVASDASNVGQAKP